MKYLNDKELREKKRKRKMDQLIKSYMHYRDLVGEIDVAESWMTRAVKDCDVRKAEIAVGILKVEHNFGGV